ncbi:MAG: hypothetical protein RL291_1288, partial [Pseudomonadota bacterium]
MLDFLRKAGAQPAGQAKGDRAEAIGSGHPDFERKIRRTQRALYVEQLWPWVWALSGLFLAFVLVSLAGVWTLLPEWGHFALLAAFGLGAAGILGMMATRRMPEREAAVARLERLSDVPHRPASTYEDTLPPDTADPQTRALWEAHR